MHSSAGMPSRSCSTTCHSVPAVVRARVRISCQRVSPSPIMAWAGPPNSLTCRLAALPGNFLRMATGSPPPPIALPVSNCMMTSLSVLVNRMSQAVCSPSMGANSWQWLW